MAAYRGQILRNKIEQIETWMRAQHLPKETRRRVRQFYAEVRLLLPLLGTCSPSGLQLGLHAPGTCPSRGYRILYSQCGTLGSAHAP
jgi:hypothetical protein